MYGAFSWASMCPPPLAPPSHAQTKENLTLRASSFGSKCELPSALVDKVAKCGVMDAILNYANFKCVPVLTLPPHPPPSRPCSNSQHCMCGQCGSA